MNRTINELGGTSPSNSKESVRVGRLDTINDVRNELARLYRAARKATADDLDAHTAAKLAYLLNCIGRSLEGSEFEKRLNALEKQAEIRCISV